AVAEDHGRHQRTAGTELPGGERLLGHGRGSLALTRRADLAYDRVGDRDACAEGSLHPLAGHRGDDQLIAVEQGQLRGPGVDERSRALGHELQDAVEVGEPTERPPDLRGGLEALVRALELVVASADVSVEARVRDGD